VRRTTKELLALIGQLAAAAALVSTLVGLVFVFRPGCRPQDVAKATISDVHVRPMTFERYLALQGVARGNVSEAQLRLPGETVAFHYEITGLSGKQLPLRWVLNDNATSAPVAEYDAVTIVPSTNDEARDWYVWVPLPKTRRKYYVTVTIYQPQKERVPLKHFDTPPFSGTRA
jgi:hypothetical protein